MYNLLSHVVQVDLLSDGDAPAKMHSSLSVIFSEDPIGHFLLLFAPICDQEIESLPGWSTQSVFLKTTGTEQARGGGRLNGN